MKLFHKAKDGGTESTVTGWWLIEAKSLFSVVLLRFDGPSREAYHTHAFHCISWVLRGALVERMLDGRRYGYFASWRPFLTTRKDFHKVDSCVQHTYVLSIRGPWRREWCEYLPATREVVHLTAGRRVVARYPYVDASVFEGAETAHSATSNG